MTDDKNDTANDDIEFTEDVDVDEPDLDAAEAHSNDKIKVLRNKLKVCEEEKREHLENLQRTKAEFLNSKRRLGEQKQIEVDRATDRHIERLLPLYDSFEMAMRNREAWEALDQSWRQGMESVFTQLQGILKDYGVKIIDQTGAAFDPNIHEAIQHEQVDRADAHDTVTAVVQVGFVRMKGDTETLIRPARVAVGNFASE